jgi:hypothetical protein
MNRTRQNRYGLAVGMFLCLGLSAAFRGTETRPPAPAQSSPAVDLPSLLEKTAEYCRKLESAILDFICREEIAERIDPALDVPPPPTVKTWSTADNWTGAESRGAIVITAAPAKIKNFYVYDYQCIRKQGQIRERRTLLEENKKKKNEPNAVLKTSVIFYENALLGPVGFFEKSRQAEYDYALAGSDKFDKKTVIIVEAKPKLETPEGKDLYGKAWIDPVTGDIVKIDWSAGRVGHLEIFEKRGAKYGRKPRLTLRSEFQAEKNGIRFPSKMFIEEAYVNARGRAFVRSETTVTYKNFKFFTVEVDVRSE